MEDQSPKYRNIMNIGRELFWKHGFRRISIEEICKKAGVSKMTFYRFFPNKIELAKAIFSNVVDGAVIEFRKIMNEDTTGPEKIRKIVQMKANGSNDISKEFMEDFYLGTTPELKAFVEEKTMTTWLLMIDDIKAAQKKGWYRNDFKPEFLLLLSNKLIEILKDQQFMQMYDKPQDLILELAKFVTYGIMPRE